MDIRFVTAGSGDVVAVMASDGGELLAAGKALDTAAGGRIAKAMKAANFKGGAGQVTDILLPKSIADHVWTIYTWLFAAGFLGLLLRLMT